MIPHAGYLHTPASAALALTIAVVESTFGAQAMAAAGAPQALRAGFGRAARPAIDVAAVAAPADGEDRLAARASRQPQRRRREIHGLVSRPGEGTTDDTPGSAKTCDNPGWSSLCAFEDRGSSTRGLGASTPGPHLLLAHGRARRRPYAPGAVDTGAATCGHCRVGAARRGSTFGRAGRSPLGQGPLDQEKPNPSPRAKPTSAAGGMFRKRRF